MKKILSIMGLSLGLFASEIQFGQGSFKVDAAFLGLSSSDSEKITTYSLVNEHKNIFSTKFFYSYKLAYYKSNTLSTTYDTTSIINGITSKALLTTSVPNSQTVSNQASQASQTSQPSTQSVNNLSNKYLIYTKLRGVDLNIVLGRDFINQDNEDTYFGAGLLIGASFPYLKTNSSNNNNDSTQDYLKKSKTKFYTYKLGLVLKGQKSFNGIVNLYADTAYAKQTAKVKNNVLHLDSSSNGDYFTFNTGVKFQAKTKKKIGFITLSPALFATVGYRYDYWKVNDVKVNSLTLNTDITLKVSQVYAGLGYDF